MDQALRWTFKSTSNLNDEDTDEIHGAGYESLHDAVCPTREGPLRELPLRMITPWAGIQR
jgi:hypothetical protein